MIRLSKSSITHAEKRAVEGVLDREFLGMGAEVQQFEEVLASFFGRSTICVGSGTAALHLALQAIGLKSGDEVLVQSLTYVASFQAISMTGAIPIACDVNPKTLTIDCVDAEKRLTPRTKAIMPVHYTGGIGDLDAVYAFARKHGLRVIEDAAHAFGTTHQGKKVGENGDVVCFSFDGIKNITSGEGGCIVTSDKDVIKKVQDARLLGVEKDTEKRYAGARSWDFDVTQQGWRYHMSNIMAAIGLEQIKRFPKFVATRRALAAKYDSILADCSQIKTLHHDYGEVVPHIYVVCLQVEDCRDSLREFLYTNGIQTGIHYLPNHYLSLYKQDNRFPLPVTDRIYPKILTLPLHSDLTKESVSLVCMKLKSFFA